MPKISIIIPIYKVEKYIERCARSLFEQTLDDIEYIFVDDCSPDKSIAILENIIKEYQPRLNKEHKNVRIEKMSQNSGLPNVRRYGIKLATSDYIAHCDSDDWVELDMYQQMYNKAIEEDADVVVCDYVVTNGTSVSKTINACHAKSPGQLIENCLFQRDPWPLWNKLFKRKAYSNIEYPKGAMGEDFATTIQLFKNVTKLSYIPKPYYHYFQNPTSTIHQQSKAAVLRKFHQLLDNTNIAIRHLEKSKDFHYIVGRAKPLMLMSACGPLLALFEDREIRKIWRQACPRLSFWYLIKTPFPIYSKYSYVKYTIKYWLTK